MAVIDFKTGFESGNLVVVRGEQFSTYRQGDRVQGGLYLTLREVGETSSVFEVTGRIMGSGYQHDHHEGEEVIQKVDTYMPQLSS